jgi:RNA-directed DNA polymerase
LFLKYCARLIDLDPNPSRFIRQMVFGANDFDVFISHASEDKGTIARPIYNACVKIGVKAFLDEEHIAWGESFTKKINVALGSARTVLAIVSTHSVSKDWPLAEINTALSMEVSGHKSVLPLMVGKPNLQHLPLIRGKNHMVWSGDAMAVARRLKDLSKPRKRGAIAVTQSPGTSFWKRLFGGDKKS